jgi:hypothetical protein
MSKEETSSGEVEHSIDGLDPKFAVDNRIDMCLGQIRDISREWAYVRFDGIGVDSLRNRAESLERTAAELQAAADRYEESEYHDE